ncbi:MAG: twin-arginine translocase TatA/TatE family subunit [Sandaracinaceae bacterium]
MGRFGMGELLIVLVCLLLVFGATRLPQIGEGLGKAIRNLKRGLNADDDIEVSSAKDKQIASESSTPRTRARDEVAEAEVVDS